MAVAFIYLMILITLSASTSKLVINNQSSIVCNNINSQYGCTNTRINCLIDTTCIVDCNKGCINVVIDAEMSSYLTVLNCNGNHHINYCTNMIIYTPRNGNNGARDSCTFNGNGSITNSMIYTQESFNDFTISKQLTMINTEIYCGRTMEEHSCISAEDGLSCSPDSNDKICDVFTLNQTQILMKDDISVATSDHHNVSIIAVIIWVLIFIGIVLFCFCWIRQEIYHKNRPKSSSPVLSHPLLFNSRNTYTETVSSVEAGTSYSCDTMIFRSSNTSNLMGLAMAQSMPILIGDNMDTSNDMDDDLTDLVDLEYPDSEKDDALLWDEDTSKSNINGDRNQKLENDEFIMMGHGDEKEVNGKY